jgi:gluconokinase
MFSHNPTRFLIVMGVAGCGKTTVGKAMAERLGWNLYDANDFHPPENIERMTRGIPLTDADRVPWLTSLHDLISFALAQGQPGVLACSALKDLYRQQLLKGHDDVDIVFLKGGHDLIWSRLYVRQDHYMKPHTLASQFEALEEPREAWKVDASKPVLMIVEEILARLKQ